MSRPIRCLLLASGVLACAGSTPGPPGRTPPPPTRPRIATPGCSASLTAAATRAMDELGVRSGEVHARALPSEDPLVRIAVRVSDPHPPASTVKPLLTLAALDAGLVSADEAIPCAGTWTRGDLKGECFFAHPPQTLESALATSCNAYFLELAWRLGPERLAGVFDAAGLHGVAQATRSSDGGGFLAAALGHGGAKVRADAIASAYARLLRSPSPHLSTILAGMRRTFASAEGSAHGVAVEGIPLAGKTGTAEGDEDGTRHAWMVTLAPADDPRLLVVVHVDGPGTGATLAGPVVQRVVDAWARTCPPRPAGGT